MAVWHGRLRFFEHHIGLLQGFFLKQKTVRVCDIFNLQNGLLMSTRHDRSADRLEVTLEAGRVRVRVEMGQSEKSVYAGHSLNDDIYHTIVFR